MEPISWVCPGAYLRAVALPALRRGADSAGRPVPPLVAHCAGVRPRPCQEARAGRQQVRLLRAFPLFTRTCFAPRGLRKSRKGPGVMAMIDAVAHVGDEARVAEALARLFAMGRPRFWCPRYLPALTGRPRSNAPCGCFPRLPKWRQREGADSMRANAMAAAQNRGVLYRCPYKPAGTGCKAPVGSAR